MLWSIGRSQIIGGRGGKLDHSIQMYFLSCKPSRIHVCSSLDGHNLERHKVPPVPNLVFDAPARGTILTPHEYELSVCAVAGR